MTFAPPTFYRPILRMLRNERRPVFAQVATTGKDGVARIRTVHLRYLPEYGTFGFNTHVRSRKWLDLAKKPVLGGCYYLPQKKSEIQYRWESPVKLIDPLTRNSKEKKLLERMWGSVRPEVRQSYWQDAAPTIRHPNLKQRCLNFGTVVCQPNLWDIYERDFTGKMKDRRTLHTLKARRWWSCRISLLDGKKIG